MSAISRFDSVNVEVQIPTISFFFSREVLGLICFFVFLEFELWSSFRSIFGSGINRLNCKNQVRDIWAY